MTRNRGGGWAVLAVVRIDSPIGAVGKREPH
jgi:hypothetical protein